MDKEYHNWVSYFLDIANVVARKSKDPSTKIGVVIVGPNNEIRSTGFNGFPRGVHDQHVSAFATGREINVVDSINEKVDRRYERPVKYKYTEHGERNAIYHAARNGHALEGCTLFINSYPIPCTDCTRAVIQSGIKEIIGTDAYLPKGSHWDEDMEHAKQMLYEAGVQLHVVSSEQRDEVITFVNDGENNA